MSKVIRRPSVSTLPPRADDYKEAPPVQITHREKSIVAVKTFCGVSVKCRVIETRHVKEGAIYRVKPTENRWREFKESGVPLTQDNAMDEFTAFDWQITPCRDT